MSVKSASDASVRVCEQVVQPVMEFVRTHGGSQYDTEAPSDGTCLTPRRPEVPRRICVLILLSADTDRVSQSKSSRRDLAAI